MRSGEKKVSHTNKNYTKASKKKNSGRERGKGGSTGGKGGKKRGSHEFERKEPGKGASSGRASGKTEEAECCWAKKGIPLEYRGHYLPFGRSKKKREGI